MLYILTTLDDCGVSEYVRLVESLGNNGSECRKIALTGELSVSSIETLAKYDVEQIKFGSFRCVDSFRGRELQLFHPFGKLCKLFIANEFIKAHASEDDLVLFLDPDTLLQTDVLQFADRKVDGKVLFGYEIQLIHTEHRRGGRLMVASRFDAESAYDRNYFVELNTGVVLGRAVDFTVLMDDFQRFVQNSRYMNIVSELDDKEKWHDQDFFRYFYRSTLRSDVATFELKDVYTSVGPAAKCLYYDVASNQYRTVWGSKPGVIHFAGGTFAAVPRVHPIQNYIPEAKEVVISIGSPQPVERALVLVKASMRHLIQSWLDSHRNINVEFVADTEADESFCQELRASVDYDVPSNFATGIPDVKTGILPHSGNSRELEFVPGVYVPQLGPEVYESARKLSRLGAKKLILMSYGGQIQLDIPRLLDDFVDRHKGQRCFVVGNGPSLNEINMELLSNEITFGSNRCYMGFEKWGFGFSYWGIMDRLQIEEYADEYEQNIPAHTTKFFPFEYLPFLKMENVCPVNFNYDARPPYRFSDSPSELYLGFTVTHMLLQIAAIMGCNPIYLIGCDHRYNLNKVEATLSTAGTKNAQVWTAESAVGATHFTSEYVMGNRPKRFITPKPDKSEAAFQAARDWSMSSGVSILNATPNSGLEIFPKVSYSSIF